MKANTIVSRFYALLSEGMVYSCPWINRWFDKDLSEVSGPLAVVVSKFLDTAERFVVGKASSYTMLRMARHLDRACWLYAGSTALSDDDDELVAIGPVSTGGIGICCRYPSAEQYEAGACNVSQWIAEVIADLALARKFHLASQRAYRAVGAIKRAMSWYEARTLYCAAAADESVSQYEDLEDSLWEAIQAADRRLRPQGGVALRRVA